MKRTVLDELSATRRQILRILKNQVHATIPQLAASLQLAHESVRQQVLDLQHSGWITAICEVDIDPNAPPAAGRPPVEYCLTPAGDHFFPKDYHGLLVQLLDSQGDAALQELAAAVTDDRVERLRGRVRGLSLPRKLDALLAIYLEEDAYTEVEAKGRDFVLIEKNCPYLNAALERPIICSTTVSTLRRLLRCEIVRERRFQDGDGRCEFHVKVKRRIPGGGPRFELEPPKSR